MARILIVDDDPADRHLLVQILENGGHMVLSAASAEEGLHQFESQQPDVVVLDVLLPDRDGMDLYRHLRELNGAVPAIFITASGSSNMAIEAMQLGALDYLVKPLRVSEVREVVQRAVEVRRMSSDPVTVDPLPADTAAGDVIIGRSPAMQEVYKAIGLVASQNVTVLIRGESGTGKELVARALYQFSNRSKGPFLAVNCAAIPETLLESELFGHEKGAFTGADRQRVGKFEQCNGGTLFLDEVGDMPPTLQSKLLRVLQEQKFQRVGGSATVHTDVRVLAATNRDLERMVTENKFREDLYFRLNGYTVYLPPLRQRGEDLVLLVEHFLQEANRELNKRVRGIAPEAMQLLRRYPWPGNVRELQNVIRQSVLQTTGPVLLPHFLPDVVVRGVPALPAPDRASMPDDALQRLIDSVLRSGSHQVYDEVIGQIEQQLVQRTVQYTRGDKQQAIALLGANPAMFRSQAALQLLDLEGQLPREINELVRPGMTMEAIEREAIRRTLEQTNGRRTEAAQMLGVSVRTLQRKIKEYDLDF
jgi:two-component system nitrogen regulation response regulator GlnG